jgi:PAS domain S-box-containing protein
MDVTAAQPAMPDPLGQSFLRTVFDVAQVGIFCVSDAGSIVSVNPAFCALTGYAEDAVVGARFTKVAPETILPIADKFLAALLANSPKLPRDWKIRHSNGQLFDVQVTHKAVAGQQARRYVVITFTDVSQRIRAEAELADLNRSLEERIAARGAELSAATGHYRQLIEQAPIAICISQGSRFKFANHHCEQLLGVSFARMQEVATPDLVHEDDRALAMAAFSNRFADGSVRPYVARYRHPHGDIRSFEVSVSTVAWEGQRAHLFFLRDISVELRLNEALARSEGQYRALAETANVGMIVLRQGTILYANPYGTQLLKTTPSQVANGQALDWVHPDDHAYVNAQRSLRNIGDQFPPSEIRFKSADGQSVWVDIRGVIAHWQDKPAALLFFQDVSARKTMQSALEASERKYRQIVERASEAILVGDRERGILYCNARMLELNRVDEPTLKAMSLLDLVHPDDRKMMMQSVGQRVAPGPRPAGGWPPIEIRTRYWTPENEDWHAVSPTPIMWEGAPSILMFAIDITGRRQLERSVNAALVQRDAILETTSVGVSYVHQRKYTWLNSTFAHLLGYTREALTGQEARITYVDEADFTRIGQEGYGAIRSGGHYSTECRLRRKDGSEVWVRLDGRLIDRKAPDAGTVWTYVDQTDRKRAEQEIRNALAREKELSELKTRFVSMASHEFRTPIAGILSSAELLSHYGERFSEGERREMLAEIQVAAKRMASMVEDVLTLGRLDSGRQRHNPVPIDVAVFCKRMLGEIKLVAGAAHVLDHDLGDLAEAGAPPATLDENLLWQTLNNLLTNACKYSPNGGTVLLHARREGEVLALAVSDNGIGIPADDQPHLFESFHRAHNVGNIPGSGLGLAIVKRAVHAMGGEIGVTSVPGQGTRFTVRLPAHWGKA